MAMSKDRIKFFFPPRHYSRPGKNNFGQGNVEWLLSKSFGLSRDYVRKLTEEYQDGFYIRCRPSQFARFIVLRFQLTIQSSPGAINGVKDLMPVLENPHQVSPMTRLTEATGVDPAQMRMVLAALGMSATAAAERLEAAEGVGIVNVSRNDAVEIDP